jgi:NADPH-dependent 2,4-dienoyl-CoA reductase/sulfur reductase-like enzyme
MIAEMRKQVCVVGAGPGGLAAAVTAAAHGARVLLIDEEQSVGGRIWRRDGGRLPPNARAWLQRADAAGVERIDSARVVGVDADGALLAIRHGDTLRIVSTHIVLATGASEHFLPFEGWTLPGVCGVGGLQAFAKSGLDLVGQRVLIAGSGPLLLAVAAGLRKKGAKIVAILEQTPKRRVRALARWLIRRPRKLTQGAALLARLVGVPRHHDAWPLCAEGDDRLRRVVVRIGDRTETIAVDWLACAFGLVPNTDLAEALGCRIEAGRVVVDEHGFTTQPYVLAVGEALGIGGVDAAIAEGIRAGLAITGRSAELATAARRCARERDFASRLETAYGLRDELRAITTATTIVCRCEDVPWSTLAGHSDLREAKLQTRAGMGACQGRICGPALTFLRNGRPDRRRPPSMPVTFEQLRGFARSDCAADEPISPPKP